MNRHQYKPDLSVRHSPRASSQRRAMVSRICKRHEMPEADVLRYSLEAAVLTSGEKLERATSSDPLSNPATQRSRFTKSSGR